MKIISKFKDYYDYLSGIYGIDEKLVLDRTNFTPTLKYYNNDHYSLVRFIICDKMIEGIWNGNEFIYGNEIYTFFKDSRPSYDSNFITIPYFKNDINKKRFGSSINVLNKPIDYKNISENPIYIWNGINYYNKKESLNLNNYNINQILKDYQLHKLFSAEEIWLMLSEWLGKEKIIEHIQSNENKIISNGFDLKTSFRKM